MFCPSSMWSCTTVSAVPSTAKLWGTALVRPGKTAPHHPDSGLLWVPFMPQCSCLCVLFRKLGKLFWKYSRTTTGFITLMKILLAYLIFSKPSCWSWNTWMQCSLYFYVSHLCYKWHGPWEYISDINRNLCCFFPDWCTKSYCKTYVKQNLRMLYTWRINSKVFTKNLECVRSLFLPLMCWVV